MSILLFISFFLIFLLPPTDPDLGWQLRCGQDFWQNRSFCSPNDFTVLLPNYYWINHHWLYQTIIFPIYQIFGFWGLTILNSLIMSSAFLLFYLSIKNYLLEKIIAIILTIFLSWGVFSFGIRSQEIGIFFFSLLLFIGSKTSRTSPVWLIGFPLITFLWANMHGGSVILGIFFIFFICLNTALFSQRIGQICLIGLIWFALFLTTFVNPFGLGIYQEAFRHFSGPINLSFLIAEWVPPAPPIWWIILITVLILSGVLLFSQNKGNLLLIIFLLMLAFLGLKARRNLPFYFIFLFSTLFQSKILEKINFLESKSQERGILALFIIFFLSIAGLIFILPKTIKTNMAFDNYCLNSSIVYPCPAIEFLKKQPPGQYGNLYNRYEWGGFLIWQLPEYKIFVDGRMPAWDNSSQKSPYTLYLEILQNQPGWQETLKEYDINWILISPGTFMDLLLRENPTVFGWQEAYRDKIAVVYKKAR